MMYERIERVLEIKGSCYEGWWWWWSENEGHNGLLLFGVLSDRDCVPIFMLTLIILFFALQELFREHMFIGRGRETIVFCNAFCRVF